MSPRKQEDLRRLALRAFAVEFCNAPVRKGEPESAAKQAIEKAAKR